MLDYPSEVIGFDTETFLMGPGAVIPKMVCLGVSLDDSADAQILGSNADTSVVEEAFTTLLDPDTEMVSCAHNLAFDASVLWKYYPDALPLIFDAIESGRWQCTQLREKLLNLTTYGSIDYEDVFGEEKPKKQSYSLMALMLQRFGIDLSDKKQGEDIWRLNYSTLDGVPVEEWPEDAIEYAIDDAEYCRQLWLDQEARRQAIIKERNYDPFETLAFRCMLAFCLRITTNNGIHVDVEFKERWQKQLEEDYAPHKMDLLLKEHIISLPIPPQPYKNGAKHPDGTPKMKKAVPSKTSKKTLQAYVENLCKEWGIEPKLTDSGAVSVDKEWLGDYADRDPVLTQYADRQSVLKLMTTELPRLEWENVTQEVIHPEYDPLKRSGRTSSFAGKLYPSFNLQNVDRRARNLFVPREGHLLLSTDFSAMELGTAAQTCINTVGYSILGDLINSGVDAHAYLGAQLAYFLDAEFRQACEKNGVEEKKDIYEAFLSFKSGDEDQRKFFKLYRTFAKPTGLGYLGGLGPETFIIYSKTTYGVDLVEITGSEEAAEELANDLREVWRETFPEMKEYHDWINKHAQDPWNSEPDHQKYVYETPMGLVRPGCDYCAAANGMALQSPSAEGMYTAFNQLIRETYDPTLDSPLYGLAVPIGPIHDEMLADIPDVDIVQRTDMIKRMEDTMISCMQQITPDVKAGVESALMERWDKRAEPVYDNDGNLLVWRPE